MKESRRTKRMERHHKRSKDRTASLNMVSLMDIFTILVFFLLVTSSESEVLPSAKTIKLPTSSAEKRPKVNIIILVNKHDILVKGKKIASVQTALSAKEPIIKPLIRELQRLNRRAQERTGKSIYKRGVTIMGDKAIPYRLLKKIMLTCATAKFSNISLAVVQKTPARQSPGGS